MPYDKSLKNNGFVNRATSEIFREIMSQKRLLAKMEELALEAARVENEGKGNATMFFGENAMKTMEKYSRTTTASPNIAGLCKAACYAEIFAEFAKNYSEMDNMREYACRVAENFAKEIKHNGWSNYSTWHVAILLNNVKPLYDAAERIMLESVKSVREFYPENESVDKLADIFSKKCGRLVSRLAISPDFADKYGVEREEAASLYGYFLDVNYREIAEDIMCSMNIRQGERENPENFDGFSFLPCLILKGEPVLGRINIDSAEKWLEREKRDNKISDSPIMEMTRMQSINNRLANDFFDKMKTSAIASFNLADDMPISVEFVPSSSISSSPFNFEGLKFVSEDHVIAINLDFSEISLGKKAAITVLAHKYEDCPGKNDFMEKGIEIGDILDDETKLRGAFCKALNQELKAQRPDAARL